MLDWKRLGRVFDPRGRSDWMHEFAQNPNPVLMGGRLRVYFTCRPQRALDGSCVSRVGWVDLDREDTGRVLAVSDVPALDLGRLGAFDESGVMPGSVVEVPERGEWWLYYVGWSRSSPAPYRWAIGLAVSRDGGATFQRWSEGPLLGIDREDPWLLACPRVWRESENRWWMLYQSGRGWREHEGHPESEYVARLAWSSDGLNWTRAAGPALPATVERECQTSSARFACAGAPGRHQLLFSWRYGEDFRNRERGYRLGFAWSDDLDTWERDDAKAGLLPAAEGWDSEMVCYPGIIELPERTLLFYCGNAFGREGFGLAELEGWRG